MLSPLVNLLALVEQQKAKRIANKTKQEVKEVKKKVEGKDGIEKHEEVDKAKAQGRKEVIKARGKVLLLRCLAGVLHIIESIIVYIVGTIGLVGCFVVLAVLVIMISLYGFLQTDFKQTDGTIYKGKTNCVTGGAAIGDYNFDDQILNQLGGTLTEQEKNIYRLMQVYSQGFNGDFGKKMWSTNFPEVTNVFSTTELVGYMTGFVSVENSFNFNNGNKNILTNTAKFGKAQGSNGNTYGGFGLNVSLKLDSYVPDIAASVKAKYPQPSDYTGYDTDFVPWGAIMHMNSLEVNYMRSGKDYVASKDAVIESLCVQYGVTANKEKLKGYLVLFSTSAYYHGGGPNESLLSLWIATWASTSTVDAERDFNNIKITSTNYTESYARQVIVGTTGRDNLTMSWGQSVTPYFEINGTKVTTTLWDYVRNNCGNTSYFDTTAKTWLDSTAGNTLILNGHYGFISYLVGQVIQENIGVSAPIASGGSSVDCECTTGSGSLSIVGSIDTTKIQKGQVQGSWDAGTKAYLESKSSSIKKYYGEVSAIEKPNTQLADIGVTVEEWRVSSKWQVPYYYQSNSAKESGEQILASEFPSLSSMGAQGCHIYMYSYMASALKGEVINPVEMGMALKYNKGLTSGGVNQQGGAVTTFNNLGLKAVALLEKQGTGDIDALAQYAGLDVATIKSTSSSDMQKTIDAILDKNGIVGFAGGPNYFTTGNNHYVVITEKTQDGYKVMGYNEKGTYPKGSTMVAKTTQKDVYNWEYIYAAMHSHTAAGYNFQRFYAFNESIGSVNTSSTNCSSASTDVSMYTVNTSAKILKEDRWVNIMGNSYVTYFEKNWVTGMTDRGKSTKWKNYVSEVQNKDLVLVEVTVWDLDNGKWVDYKMPIIVHSHIAGSVEAIFKELYELPEKERTPIHKYTGGKLVVGVVTNSNHNAALFGASNRGGGTIHNIGACFDVNPDENPMPGSYGNIANYKPGIDPYSISDTSKFVEIMGKYGFERGRAYQDYMHFSYLESVDANINTYGK